ncbi:MAG: hypothetical protein ACKVX9_07335, partial [Blastocatellia bacterium]
MRSKSTMLLLIAAGLSLTMLGVGGCRMRAGRQEKKVEAQIAPSDSAPDAKAAAPPLAGADTEGVDFAEKEEIRRSYTLKPGAVVNVHGINGQVRVETGEGSIAEVLIVRSAKKKEDLQYRQLNIEHGEEGLTIRTESDRKSIFSAIGSLPEGRQRVLLRLPKKVDFETNGINGNVEIAGDLNGRAEIRGVTGSVKVARINGETNIVGINGSVDVTFAPLTGKSIEMRGVNGNIEMRFEGEVNAEVRGRGVNGQIQADLPKVEKPEGEERLGRTRLRIGTGGTPI